MDSSISSKQFFQEIHYGRKPKLNYILDKSVSSKPRSPTTYVSYVKIIFTVLQGIEKFTGETSLLTGIARIHEVNNRNEH